MSQSKPYLNDNTPKDISGLMLDVAYSANLNLPRLPRELDENRIFINWLTELDEFLSAAKERDFDLFCDDDPEERESIRFKLATALHKVVSEENKGSVSFPVDHLTRLRWASGILKPWCIDEDTLDLTDAQSKELNGFFERLAATLDEVCA